MKQLPSTQSQQRAQIISTLQSNLSALNELALHYGVTPTGQIPFPEAQTTITAPEHAYQLLAPKMAHLRQEQIRVLLLNIKGGVIAERTIYQGTVDAATLRVSEILRDAVIENAPRILIAHNHPSGDPQPSHHDRTVTRTIADACRLLDIELMDHVIIGHNGRFHSLKADGYC